MESLGYTIEQSKKRDIVDLIRKVAGSYDLELNNIKVLGFDVKKNTIEIVEISVNDIFVDSILYKIKQALDEVEIRTGYFIKQKKVEI